VASRFSSGRDEIQDFFPLFIERSWDESAQRCHGNAAERVLGHSVLATFFEFLHASHRVLDHDMSHKGIFWIHMASRMNEVVSPAVLS
jgi:hypothetical protein